MTVSAFPDAAPDQTAPPDAAEAAEVAEVAEVADANEALAASVANLSDDERATLFAAQRDAQKTIERAPVNDVPLSELQGLTLADQFYQVWGSQERGLALWQAWKNTLGAAGDSVLEQYAQSTSEELQIDLDEARARIAVDKVLHDCGPQFATRFMERYYAEQLQKGRRLQPMAPRRRKK